MNMVSPKSFGMWRGVLLCTSLVTHFSMWALLKSPLMMGHDLLSMVRFFVSGRADDPWYPFLICLSVQRNLGDYHEHGNHRDKPGPKRTARDTAMEETTS